VAAATLGRDSLSAVASAGAAMPLSRARREVGEAAGTSVGFWCLVVRREEQMFRKAGFVTFGLVMAFSATYVAGRHALKIGLGEDWGAPIMGAVFTAAVLLIDRPSVGA
jgi:hypothetical protein